MSNTFSSTPRSDRRLEVFQVYGHVWHAPSNCHAHHSTGHELGADCIVFYNIDINLWADPLNLFSGHLEKERRGCGSEGLDLAMANCGIQ